MGRSRAFLVTFVPGSVQRRTTGSKSRNPPLEQRDEFFASVLADARRPPNQFPDGVKRRRRVLEELPIAPPVEPRQLTEAELAVQEENDQRVITLLKWRLGPILTELKRKFKRFTKRAAVRQIACYILTWY
jgi:hypothetical protein